MKGRGGIIGNFKGGKNLDHLLKCREKSLYDIIPVIISLNEILVF